VPPPKVVEMMQIAARFAHSTPHDDVVANQNLYRYCVLRELMREQVKPARS
jgi:hypothetical protein